MKTGHSFQTSQFQHALRETHRTRSAEYATFGSISTIESPIGQQHLLGSPLPRMKTVDHLSVSKGPLDGPINTTLSDSSIGRPPATMSQILEGVQFSTTEIDFLFQM
jgi:hypothetical protein